MTTPNANNRKRLAIIGAGSSGLISLKFALDMLPDWDVQCFEQSDRLTGAWGHPYNGFVSTSTKYTTQFACYPQFDASVCSDGGTSRKEFFRDGEYGEYLSCFADEFSLKQHVALNHTVTSIRRLPESRGWEATIATGDSPKQHTQLFDAVIVCAGLVAKPKTLGNHPHVASPQQLRTPEGLLEITSKKAVVIGGGEMATDVANLLAQPALGNKVYLSLRSGIRVSPRYHPIRGVPSDFLRNRLMLSIHEDLRNWIGKRFVAARIRYQDRFERLFPPTSTTDSTTEVEHLAKRKQWGEKLNRQARSNLFDMFHNKSDDFLTAIAEDRLEVVGPPVDATLTMFYRFGTEGAQGSSTDGAQAIDPEVVVPALGFQSNLNQLTGGVAQITDFYLGCTHVQYDDLFLVGFARPVIGNIPSISEMQARYVIQTLAGRTQRPSEISIRHAADTAARQKRFGGVENPFIYPVEMFPYCDRLAEEMKASPRSRTLREWWAIQTAPATTLDYACFDSSQPKRPTPPTYLPITLVALLFALKPIDWFYRLVRRYS